MPSAAKKQSAPKAVYVVCDVQSLMVQLADGDLAVGLVPKA